LKKVVLIFMRPSQQYLATGLSAMEDRRAQSRYPVKLELRCKPVGSEATWLGKTADMSSNGVRFSIGRELAIGVTVELRVKWPTTLSETSPLELVLKGRVIRCDGNGMVIQTHHYAFGTRKMRTIQESKPEQPDLLSA